MSRFRTPRRRHRLRSLLLPPLAVVLLGSPLVAPAGATPPSAAQREYAGF